MDELEARVEALEQLAADLARVVRKMAIQLAQYEVDDARKRWARGA